MPGIKNIYALSHNKAWSLLDKPKIIILIKKVSMVSRYYNHKLQTNPWHLEEEPHNNHETPGRQTKQGIHYDDCKNKMDTKERTTKHRAISESHNGSNNQ